MIINREHILTDERKLIPIFILLFLIARCMRDQLYSQNIEHRCAVITVRISDGLYQTLAERW